MNLRNITCGLTSSEDNLSMRIVKSGFWALFLRIVQQLFNVARLIIVGRILSPKEFGIMGIALLLMATLVTFSETGFQQALIKKKGDIASFLDATWTVLLIRGLILFLVIYWTAPYVSNFFNSSEAEPIIRVIGLSVIFQALTNIKVIYFQKDLELHKEFAYQFLGTMGDFIVSIASVLILRNVWALVFGLLAGNIIRCFMSYLIFPYRPHITFDPGKVKELFDFGKWILGSSILIFLLTQGDKLIVGKLLGATALGLYTMAYTISNIPATEITNVITTVTFPAYSKLQNDEPKLKEMYQQVLQTTVFMSVPISGFIYIFSSDFTRVFLEDKWMPIVPLIQVIAFVGMIRSIGGTTGPMFQVLGRPELLTKLNFLTLILLILLIVPLSIKWGVLGASYSAVFSVLISNLVAFFLLKRMIRFKVLEIVKIISIPILNTMFVISFIFILKTYLVYPMDLLRLISVGTSGVIFYGIIAYISKFGWTRFRATIMNLKMYRSL